MQNVSTIRPELKARIERLINANVESYSPVSGGYTPALRLLCSTGSNTYFVKIGTTALTSEFINREIKVYSSISGHFMPSLIASEHHELEPILILESLSAHHWPPPWNTQRIDMALAQMDAMHNTKVSIEPYETVHDTLGSGWQAVAADPLPFTSLGIADSGWLHLALPTLIEYEARCDTAGDSLTHWDLRSDNICFTEKRAIFVDWNHACLSNPKLDLGFWLPSLAYEGGPAPESILSEAPEVAAWVTGFFAARAGLPKISDAPRVRTVQRQQLETALPWAARALDLPPPVVR